MADDNRDEGIYVEEEEEEEIDESVSNTSFPAEQY